MRIKPFAPAPKFLLILTVVLISGVHLASQLPPPANPSLSVDSLSFGNQPIETSSVRKTIVITNRGSSPLFVFKATASADFAVTTSCIRPLRHDESCEVKVSFSPSFSGPENGFLTILDSSLSSPHSIALSGTGVARGIRRVTLKEAASGQQPQR